MTQNFKQTFNIIKHRNDPDSAVTLWSNTVYRTDKVFMDNFSMGGEALSGFVEVVNDAHFVYELKDHPRFANMPAPKWLCTCGALAGFLPISAFVNNMTITTLDTSIRVVNGTIKGVKLACLHRWGMVDQETGDRWNRHADGSLG